MNVVDIKNLSFAYDGVPVLENVNLAVPEQDFVTIVGPNGGGKTTLLKLLLGLLEPDRGTVEVFGTTPARARSRIGYVPQYFRFDLAFPIKVLDVVLMGRFGHRYRFGWFGKSDKDRASAALAEVGLTGLENRRFATLSGGQRQRVLIARALAAEPDLLLLDEPTSNMDAVIQEELQELLARLNERHTLLMVTHDIAFVATHVKSVACVNRRLVLHPTSELTQDVVCDLYGRDMRLIRHDHRCDERGHQCSNSSTP